MTQEELEASYSKDNDLKSLSVEGFEISPEFDKDVTENMFQNWPETKELMSYIDVVVDGKFEEDKKDLKLKFRGSSNQRIIDV